MSTQQLGGTTALVTGASRGFGRAIAIALSSSGAGVGVARDRARLEELRAHLGGTSTPVADVTDPVIADQLLDQHRLPTLVPNAGAAPSTRPIHRARQAGADVRVDLVVGQQHTLQMAVGRSRDAGEAMRRLADSARPMLGP